MFSRVLFLSPAEWQRLDEAFVQIYNNNTTSWENIGTSFIDSSVWIALDNGDAATWDNVGEAHNGIGSATEDPLVRTKGSGWTDDYVNGSNEVRIRVTNKGKINGTTWDLAHVYDYARIDFTYTPTDVTPDTFDFTDQTGVAVSTQVESDIVLVTGMVNGTAISIDGGGSYEYRICSDDTCSGAPAYTSTAGTIDAGKYVQLRLTSSAAISTATVATLTEGTANVDW